LLDFNKNYLNAQHVTYDKYLNLGFQNMVYRFCYKLLVPKRLPVLERLLVLR
jgi:hypothetical protein